LGDKKFLDEAASEGSVAAIAQGWIDPRKIETIENDPRI
jgi:hypothetical protein